MGLDWGLARTLHFSTNRIAPFSQIGPKGFILGPVPSITISYMAAYVAVFWRQIFGPKWCNRGKVFRGPKMKLGPDCAPPLDPLNPHRPSMNCKSTSKKFLLPSSLVSSLSRLPTDCGEFATSLSLQSDCVGFWFEQIRLDGLWFLWQFLAIRVVIDAYENWAWDPREKLGEIAATAVDWSRAMYSKLQFRVEREEDPFFPLIWKSAAADCNLY